MNAATTAGFVADYERDGYAFPLDVLSANEAAAYLGRIGPYVLEERDNIGKLAEKPAMLIEGMQDHAIDPVRVIAGFRDMFPDAPVIELPNAGHFCQEDAPEIIVPLIKVFLATT